MTEKVYKASKTLSKFHQDNSFVRALLGPFGCISGETLIVTEFGPIPIADIDRPMRVLSWNEKSCQYQLSWCGSSFPKGKDYLYRVTTRQGVFDAAGHHRILDEFGNYQRIDTLFQGQTLRLHSKDLLGRFLDNVQPMSLSNEPNLIQKSVNYLDDCAKLARRYGQLLQTEADNALVFPQELTDAQKSALSCDSFDYSHKDGLEELLQSHIHLDQHDDHKQTDDYLHQVEHQLHDESSHYLSQHGEHSEELGLISKLSRLGKDLLKNVRRSFVRFCKPLSFSSSKVDIISIDRLVVEELFWDMQVIDTNNYVTVDGTIHHNSGKSVACVAELLSRSCQQQADSNGKRRTKWAIVRNTYRELTDTTCATFFHWIPEELGVFNKGNMIFDLVQTLGDGTTVEAQFLFRALDRPADIKKLLSLDLTGGWINEAREIPKAIVDALQGRCGRYPETILDESDDRFATDPANCPAIFEPTWIGVILDSNPPDTDSWFYKTFEVNRPSNHAIYHQPSGLSAEAENIHHLPRNYYANMCQGKDKEWVNVYVHGNYGFVSDGKPVYPEYKDDVHYFDEDYQPDPSLLVYVGIDFGLTPAAIIGQQTASGAMVLFDELVTFDMGAVSFGKLLRQKLNGRQYEGCKFEIYGDPAGVGRAQTDEQTPFMMLDQAGISAFPTYTNDPLIRREVVADFLLRMDFTARPAFRIMRGCQTFRKSMNGGYKYKRLQVVGEERFQDVPDKNKYSHIADAGQYLFLGAVGDSRVLGGFNTDHDNDDYYDRSIV